MRLFKLAVVLMGMHTCAFAQNVDYNKIIMPNSAQNLEIEERLVQIAWKNHPLNEVERKNKRINELQLQSSRWSWLENLSVVGNLNEFNIDPERDVANRSQFFPRYNVGARVTLGMLVTLPIETKIRKEEVGLQQSIINSRKLEIRAEVLKRYSEYKSAQELFQIQNEIMEDATSTFTYFENQFKIGEIEFETYALQKMNYNQARKNLVTANTNLENRSIELEEILGVSLDEVF